MRNLEWAASATIRVVFQSAPLLQNLFFTQTTNPRLKRPLVKKEAATKIKPKDLPFNDGSLGSRNDEERRETRYVM